MTGLLQRLFGLTMLAVAIGLTTPSAEAQDFTQVELSDQQVKSFIAAQADLAPLSSKLAEAGETPDDSLKTQLEDIAKKHGFANFAEFENVGVSITMVLDGLDRKTGKYIDPIEKMKQELEDIKADNSIPAEDKKLAVDDLTRDIASAEPLKFPNNVDVVKARLAEIEALIPEEAGESAPEAD